MLAVVVCLSVCPCVHDECSLHIVHTRGGKPGSDTGQYGWPCHLAVDDNEFVFVAKVGNCRVMFTSGPTTVVHYVANSEQKDDEWTFLHPIIVFSSQHMPIPSQPILL